MASSSGERAAARAPPPPHQLAAFFKLVEKRVVAGQLCRYARNADLSAQAALQAEVLFGDDSLVVAHLRVCECDSLTNMVLKASGAEQDALMHKSWGALVSVVNLLLCRLATNTLLPSTLREEELDFTAHAQSVIRKMRHVPELPPDVMRDAVSTTGYETVVLAIRLSLNLLPAPNWPIAQKRVVQSFVLRGLDIVPLTAGIPAHLIMYEDDLLAMVEEISPHNYDPAFYAAVLCKWRSNAVSSVLRARGVLQTGVATSKQDNAEFEALERADSTKHGLRDCALPSCSKTEKTVKEFSLCAGCRSQVYCCLEHQALDWRAHKKACKEKQAARLAEEEADDEETGGGAA